MGNIVGVTAEVVEREGWGENPFLYSVKVTDTNAGVVMINVNTQSEAEILKAILDNTMLSMQITGK